MKHYKNLFGIVILFVILFFISGRRNILAAANTAGDMAVFKGVTVSPDGSAWTTDYLDDTKEHLKKGYTVITGQESSMRDLEAGEHYYNVNAQGTVRIGKWVVMWPKAQCIHEFEAMNYRGFQVNGGICESYYNNGWYAYCADCGEPVADMHIYAKHETVAQITSMPASSTYLYICPHCQGLEQGTDYQHVCKDISYNHYRIIYEKNGHAGAQVKGYMAETRHMYNNAAIYEGRSALQMGYSDTRLRKNSYSCEGYVFSGWNTRADGTGQSFEDAQTVWNLCDEEGGIVRLFAQWEHSESTLLIDANGGTYAGEAVFRATQAYGSTYIIREELLVPARGYLVQFESNGGSEVADIETLKTLSHWELQEKFYGTLSQNLYTFPAADGCEDCVKACYADKEFILPNCEKENEALVGWFLDEACTQENFLGRPGDKVSVSKDTILYAKWARLTLWARDNYVAYEGVGAVDLNWEQKDGQSKFYKIYQSQNLKEWKRIFTAKDIEASKELSEYFDTTKQGTEYLVETTGYYKLTAAGAKGADYNEELLGGSGGCVEAEYWLQKGDILTFYAGSSGDGMSGGENGSDAGGGSSTSDAGRGGGAATQIYLTRGDQKELLLVAGGGGGANEVFSGGNGGVLLSEPDDFKGEDSEYGGGGGGATGGASSAAYTTTTLEEPSTEDIAFRSQITLNTPKATQVYDRWKGGKKVNSSYPLLMITDEQWDTYTSNITVGDLARRLTITSSDTVYSTDDIEYHYNNEKVYMPDVNKSPAWDCYQSEGGFVRNFTAIYPTNGNTNVVVSGLIDSWSGTIKGYIQFQITDVDTGEMLYDVTYVDGICYAPEADAASWDIFTWGDFDISESENIQVKVRIYQYCSEAHTKSRVLDTFFYGKKVWSGSAAEGGTSYINTAYGCRNQTNHAGTNTGEGYAQLIGTDIGYREENELKEVFAKDMASPEKVEAYEVTLSDVKELSVKLAKPEDLGTEYYHMVESYRTYDAGVEHIAVSNITLNTLVSGVSGYYYYVDEESEGLVTGQHTLNAAGEIAVDMDTEVRYLHVAAVDVAGNLGATADIMLKLGSDIPTDETYPEKVKLFTEQIQIKDSDLVYQSDEKTYFVKADGVTEHVMIAKSYMSGAATQDYQIDSLRFFMSHDSNSKGWFQTDVPKGNILDSVSRFGNDNLTIQKSEFALDFLKPGRVTAERQDYGVRLELEQCFLVEADTSAFEVYPQAIAGFKEKIYYSEEQADRLNGVTIIPDGAAPVIEGFEKLQNLKVLDMTEDSMQIELYAWDELSGLAEFVVYVSNKDNFLKQEFSCAADGKMVIVLDKSNPLFVGEITISAVAVDRVGNANVIGENGLTFTLDTRLYRERNPAENVFKTGDGAVLEIETRGYVERLEVIFPEDLLRVHPELNQVYEYEFPYLNKKEVLYFNIPLGIEHKEYEVTVKAYKNGQVLISKPTMIIVEGNVLDELRTRIRNNG